MFLDPTVSEIDRTRFFLQCFFFTLILHSNRSGNIRRGCPRHPGFGNGMPKTRACPHHCNSAFFGSVFPWISKHYLRAWNRLWVGRQLSLLFEKTIDWTTGIGSNGYPKFWMVNKSPVVFEIVANSWNPPSFSKRGSCENYVLSVKERCLIEYVRGGHVGGENNKNIFAWELNFFPKENSFIVLLLQHGRRAHTLYSCQKRDRAVALFIKLHRVILTHVCVFGWNLNMRPLKWKLLWNCLFCGSW